MAIEVTALASGSKGNAVLITSGESRLLIDCGVSVTRLAAALAEAGTDFSGLKGILVTHEHDDHIRSIAAVSENYAIPVYANERTLNAVKRRTGMKGGYYYTDVNPFAAAGFEIRPFRISHDAVYPVGYSVSDGRSRFVYATDLGYFSPTVMEAAAAADIVMIESNHDVNMLIHGTYPRYLKERILGTRGHLSNLSCAQAMIKIAETGTRKFILGHLSEQNNTYELAYGTAVENMDKAGARKGEDYEMVVATQYVNAETVKANER